MNKLKAFTLLELSIALLLTTVVISIGYMALGMIDRQQDDFRAYNAEVTDLQQLHWMLANDFDRAELALIQPDRLQLEFNDQIPVQYSFESDRIIRYEPEHTDTFTIANQWIKGYFDRQEQVLPQAPIDEFEVQGQVDESPLKFHFTKTYSANQLMALENLRDGN